MSYYIVSNYTTLYHTYTLYYTILLHYIALYYIITLLYHILYYTIGILPQILDELLAARKRAKRDMAVATDPMEKAVQNGRQLGM